MKANTNEKACITPFTKKCDLGITLVSRGITLIPTTTKVYNALLLNRIRHEVVKILRKMLNGFGKNRSTTSHILTMRQIIEGVL